MKAVLQDELRSKPIGFYTWNADLERIFRQDRMLQSELTGRAGIDALVQALHRDAVLRKTYEQYLTLVARLTNPLVAERPDLRKALGEIDARRALAIDKGIWFFPPSRAHEAELVKKLFGNQPVPPGFDLQEELIRRIRTGQLNLAPTPESGWYDHQTWALEPLVVPEKTSEASRLRLSDAYRTHLIELFKGLARGSPGSTPKAIPLPGHRASAPGFCAGVLHWGVMWRIGVCWGAVGCGGLRYCVGVLLTSARRGRYLV